MNSIPYIWRHVYTLIAVFFPSAYFYFCFTKLIHVPFRWKRPFRPCRLSLKPKPPETSCFWARPSRSACSWPCGRFPKRRRPSECEFPQDLDWASLSFHEPFFETKYLEHIGVSLKCRCVVFSALCLMGRDLKQKKFASSQETSPEWLQSKPRGFIRSCCRRRVSKPYQRYKSEALWL